MIISECSSSPNNCCCGNGLTCPTHGDISVKKTMSEKIRDAIIKHGMAAKPTNDGIGNTCIEYTNSLKHEPTWPHCEKCNFPLQDQGTPNGLVCLLCDAYDKIQDLKKEWRKEIDNDKEFKLLCLNLSAAWFYGGWKAETINEKEMEKSMRQLGYWPTTESLIIQRRYELNNS